MSTLAEFYKAPKSVKQYIAMSRGIDGAEHIEILKQHLKPETFVLEIGSGPGRDFELLSKDYKVVGSDLSDEFINRLQTRYPKGNFIKLDASLLATDQSFDAIYSNKVLHHLTDDELAVSITRQAELLPPHGIVCHTFWKGNGTEDFNGMFVNNHSEEDISTFFSKKFELLHLSSYSEFEKDDSILLIAHKK